MIKVTTNPNEFEQERNRILFQELKPLRDQLAELPEQEKAARKSGDIDKVRAVRKRAAEIHESLLAVAATNRQDLQAFIEEFSPIANAERERADKILEEKKNARAVFQRECERRAAELDQEIVEVEQVRNKVWTDLGLITEMQIATVNELVEQIDRSLAVA